MFKKHELFGLVFKGMFDGWDIVHSFIFAEKRENPFSLFILIENYFKTVVVATTRQEPANEKNIRRSKRSFLPARRPFFSHFLSDGKKEASGEK